MQTIWRFIFIIGAVLLSCMALFAIWSETLAPEVFAKAFVSLVVVALALSVLQSVIGRNNAADSDGP